MDAINSFRKLPIGKYMEIIAISKDDAMEEIDKQVGIIAIINDIPEDEVLHLPIPDYKHLVAQLAFLSDPDIPPQRIARCYHLGEYALVPTTDFRKVETCQYVDFQTYAADIEAHFVELLSVLLIPKGMRYNEGYDIVSVQSAIAAELPVADAISLIGFFVKSSALSIKASLNFSKRMAKGLPRIRKEKVKKEADRLLTILEGNGVG